MVESTHKVVLLVEDEEPMLDALTNALTGSGFTIVKARNGEEGLKKTLEEKPDLLVLDILLPKMDGLTLMKKVREDTWGKHVPIILLTNVSPDSHNIVQSIIDSQPAYYLVKSDASL